MKFPNYLMIISGPILAMSIACGSFAIVAATVMTISHANPEILWASHYKNMGVFGKDTITETTENQILASTIVDPNKKLKCYWGVDAANSDKGHFECFIKKASKEEIKKGGKPTCNSTDIYKITAERSKLTEKINKKIIIKEAVGVKKKYATIQVVFSIDGEAVK